MGLSWLRAAVLGFLIGPGPIAVESAEAEPRSLQKPSGHVVRGPNFYVWDEDAREAEDWALHLQSAGGPVAPSRWRAVAERSASQPAILTNEDEAEFATWIEAPADDRHISSLGCLLCLLPSLDRTCLISAWATSSDEQLRCALARALAAPFEAVGVPAVLEHLQDDPDAEVSRLARAAAAIRLASRRQAAGVVRLRRGASPS